MTNDSNKRIQPQRHGTALMLFLCVLLQLPLAAPLKSIATKVQKFVNPEFSLTTIPGAVEPLGVFDPLGFGKKADEFTLKRYREAELVHGRVGMLAVVGFLVGEKVEGSSFLFDASITGPAISHLAQVPAPFWVALLLLITKFEIDRAQLGWVDPQDVPLGQPGLLRLDYVPGDLGFDPLKLRPRKETEFVDMQNKELQNGRVAMLAAAGCLAQELVDGKGIVEHLTDTLN